MFPAFFFFLSAFTTHNKLGEVKRRLEVLDALCFMKFGHVDPKRRLFAQKSTPKVPQMDIRAQSQISHLCICS